MSQSNVIAAYLVLAFLVFITMKGELPVYLGFLLADPKQPAGSPTIKANAAPSSSGPFQLSGNSTTNANVNKTIEMGFSLFGL